MNSLDMDADLDIDLAVSDIYCSGYNINNIRWIWIIQVFCGLSKVLKGDYPIKLVQLQITRQRSAQQSCYLLSRCHPSINIAHLHYFCCSLLMCPAIFGLL
jgi:hypothetical protein